MHSLLHASVCIAFVRVRAFAPLALRAPQVAEYEEERVLVAQVTNELELQFESVSQELVEMSKVAQTALAERQSIASVIEQQVW